MLKFYPVTPMAKPRMTGADAITLSKLRSRKRLNAKEQKRANILSRWLAYSDDVRARGIHVPEVGAHICYVIPMPASWNKARRDEMRGQFHRGKRHKARKNDVDNLTKALLDVVYGDDSGVCDIRISKVWYDYGGIFVVGYEDHWPFNLPLDVRGWRAVAERAKSRAA